MNAAIKKTFAPLFALTGNPRAAVFTEPLWGIPFNLYAPFLTLFMFSLGLEDADIGILLSVGLVVQMLSGIIGGVLIDKYGRRKTMLVGDFISWAIPCLIWAFSRDFQWFLVAAIFHGMFPPSASAWECMLVEDAKPEKIIELFNWVYIAGMIAVFFAPITGIFIGVFTLVPVMRVLFIISTIMMSAKFFTHYYFSKETRQGEIRMKETAGVPIRTLLLEYANVLIHIFKTPATIRILVLIVFLHIQQIIAGNFFSLYVTQDLQLPEQYLAWFPVLRGVIMLCFFLFFQRILSKFSIYSVMLAGLIIYIIAYVLLIFAPVGMLFPLLIFTAVDACAAALFLPRRDTLVIHNVDPAERARIRSLMMVIMLGVASPFGFIIGQISGMNRQIPFIICLGLFALIALIVLIERRHARVRVAPHGRGGA